MTRVKTSVTTRAKRKKYLDKAEGYFGSKHRLFKTAKEQVMRSERYAYRDRKQKKREFRKLWITRINAACRMNDISYSKFIDGLNKAGITINRKMLAEIAINDMDAFKELVEVSKTGKVKEVKSSKTKTEKKEVVDLSSKTVAELKEIAKEKGIEGYTTMKKAELLEALK